MNPELELLLAIARDHESCATERPRIEGDAVVIPFDVQRNERWFVEHERVRNRAELLDAYGY
jgi:hypothetical protein